MKKVLMVVIDGAADRSVNGKTPLSVADKPNLDEIARRGINGIMDTIAPGIRPGSDTAHLALLGYNPFEYYTGRGPIEAAGAGIEVKPGDVAFRVNFGTVEGEGSIFDKVVVDRRAGRVSETEELVRAINEGVKLDVDFVLAKGSGHRAALVLRGEKLSDKISDTDPKKMGVKVKRCAPLDESEEAKRTAEIVNDFMEQAHRILEAHPFNEERAEQGLLKANALLLRGAGEVPHVPKFQERYGMSLAVVAGTTLIKGIGKFLGGDVIDVEGASGAADTDTEAKVDAALKALRTHDFVLLHFKAADELGHDGNFEGKKEFIERLDASLKPILSLDFSEICMVVLSDHSTPVNVREHTADPVPITIVFDGVRVDEVTSFSEFHAYKGGLCRIRGVDIVNIVLDLIDHTSKFGA